jgi:hypothetical protein
MPQIHSIWTTTEDAQAAWERLVKEDQNTMIIWKYRSVMANGSIR